MNSGQHNSPGDAERLLAAIESAAAPADGGEPVPVRSMRRDRAALRGALQRDLSLPLPTELSIQFEQAVRDEIDRSLLANLANGRPLEEHLPISRVMPRREGMGRRMARAWEELHLSRGLAAAASLALVAGVTWLAMRPGSRTLSPDAMSGKAGSVAPPGELPDWAKLPDRVASTQKPALVTPPAVVPNEFVAIADVRQTRDVGTALEWARQGKLVLRVVTDSPGRDQERMVALASDARKKAWSLSAEVPSGFAAIPAHPWPISDALVDDNAKFVPSANRPKVATLAGFDVQVYPASAAIESVRDDLERDLSSTVIFERVDALVQYPRGTDQDLAPKSAADVVWWTKPAGEWSRRVHVPLLLEYGSRARPAGGAK